MARGHRSQIKRERNAVKDTRPSAKLSFARMSVQKAWSASPSRSARSAQLRAHDNKTEAAVN